MNPGLFKNCNLQTINLQIMYIQYVYSINRINLLITHMGWYAIKNNKPNTFFVFFLLSYIFYFMNFNLIFKNFASYYTFFIDSVVKWNSRNSKQTGFRQDKNSNLITSETCYSQAMS